MSESWAPSADLPSALGNPFEWLERASAVPVAALAGGQLITGRRGFITGFSFTEHTGAATASVQLISGKDATGIILATIALAIGESAREYLPWPWLAARYGVFVNVTAGSVDGSVSTLTSWES